jgi:hypothetical protein
MKDPESLHAQRVARALADAGLIAHESVEAAYNVISRILNCCQYCKCCLLPHNNPIYCDSSSCVGKANDEELPEDD